MSSTREGLERSYAASRVREATTGLWVLGTTLFVACSLLFGCAPARSYISVDEYVARGLAGAPKLIRPGDRVQVLVRGQDQLTSQVDVRPDGEIVIPVVGSVRAAGKTPKDLADSVGARLNGIVSAPVVTVVVDRRRTAVTVLGELRSPGRYELEPSDGVADAIARAGGLTPFADGDKVFVIRRDPQLSRIRFHYESLISADPISIGFELRDGDIVVVE